MNDEVNNTGETSDYLNSQLASSRSPLDPLIAPIPSPAPTKPIDPAKSRFRANKRAFSPARNLDLLPPSSVVPGQRRSSQSAIPPSASGGANTSRLLAKQKLRRGRSEKCIARGFTTQAVPLRRSASFAKVQGELKTKWQRAKARLKFLSKMTKINEKLINYGTSRDLFDLSRRNAESVRNNLDPVIKVVVVHDCFIFLPESIFISVWSLVLVLLMLYTAYVMPYKLAFLDTEQTSWFYIELGIDILFMVDIMVNFNTAYETPSGALETSRRTIAINYLTGWFAIDFIASIPSQLIENMIFGTSQLDARVLRLARLPRLYRLLRAARLFKLSAIFKEGSLVAKINDFFQVNAGLLRLISFMCIALTCIHIMGCFWYYFAKIDDLNPNTWVVRYELIDADSSTIYLASVYWAVQTMLTVGYGDLHAFTPIEAVICILWMVVGAGAFSFTVGSLSSVLANMDSQVSNLSRRLEQLNEFCKNAKISKSLRDELRRHIEFKVRKGMFSWIDKQKVFDELPGQVKSDVAKQMYGGVISKIGFFKDKDSPFIALVVPLLQPLLVSSREIVFSRGDRATAIFFLTEGRVVFITDDETPYKEMVRGSYFGEGDILFKRKRTTTSRAAVESHMLTLSKQAFESIVVPEYPELVVTMKKVAKERDCRFEQAENRMLKFVKDNPAEGAKLKPAPVFEGVVKPVNCNSVSVDTAAQSKKNSFSIFTVVPIGPATQPNGKKLGKSKEVKKEMEAEKENKKNTQEEYKSMSVEARLSVISMGPSQPLSTTTAASDAPPESAHKKAFDFSAFNPFLGKKEAKACNKAPPPPSPPKKEENNKFAVGSQMSLIKEELDEELEGDKEDSPRRSRKSSLLRSQLGGIEDKLRQNYDKQNALEGKLQGIEQQMKKLVEILEAGNYGKANDGTKKKKA